MTALRRAALGALVWPLALLVGCGGHEPEPQASSADASDAAVSSKPAVTARLMAADKVSSTAAVVGQWGGPEQPWPIIAVHLTLLPDGRVLTFGANTGGYQSGYRELDVWDPTVGGLTDGHTMFINGTGTDLFCSSQLLMPSTGQVFISGGDVWQGGPSATSSGNRETTYFTPSTNQASKGPQLWAKRWYGSTMTMPDGQLYMQGGSGGGNTFPEVRQHDGQFRLLTSANTNDLYFEYPRIFQGGGTRVFGIDTTGKMFHIDSAGTGSFASAGQLAASMNGFGTTVQYRPGRLLHTSGTSAEVLRIDDWPEGGTPTVTSIAPLDRVRVSSNATILADGRVVVTGGGRDFFSAVDGALKPALWDPVSGEWAFGPDARRVRVYHSTALLLPDGRLLVAGSGAQPAPPNEQNAEIYHPPYLFKADGSLAERPVITAAPTVLTPGQPFTLQVDKPVSRLTLLKTGAASHGVNFDQRFTALPFVRDPASGTLTAYLPSRAAELTPGFYMVYAFDMAGVPSTARILRMNVQPARETGQVPVVTPLADRAGNTGTVVNVPVVATDPNGPASLRYHAADLPPGLTIDPLTGVISGILTRAGQYDPVIAVTDGSWVTSTRLRWKVTGSNAVPLTLAPVLGPGPQPQADSVSLSLVASGTNVRFRVNWGDGSATTAWSPNTTWSYRYTRAGMYFITVSATDDSGATVSQSLLQQVHLPVTAAAARSSTSVLWHAATAGPRVWVVNPDNHSVSVLDAQGQARLAELPVGAEPRSLALTAGGEVWVTNRQAASVSVYNATTLALVRTLALPAGSQPHGIVASAQHNVAFVALEGTGQVLRLDTASGAVTATAPVGPQPRHLALSADGGQLYVSRFITPLLPGEQGLGITPGQAGGEVVVLQTGSLSQTAMIRLRHSDAPDAENSGRGVPNYLGAMAISPDGTQAYVPSKQDNVMRGQQRDGLPLNFQNTVRAVSSRILLPSQAEDLFGRLDHDNASVASAALFDRLGNLLFVALETSREVAVVNAHSGQQVTRIPVGLAPQGLALSADGKTLFVHNFMDRSVTVHDVQGLYRGEPGVPLLATVNTVVTERLSPVVLQGKKLFYDAADPRLSREKYMSCASCHNDGGQDGRVWDLAQMGEGLRTTVSLRGRAGGQGLLHWSGNFDEVQDFEMQIRELAGGTGLMTATQLAAGTRSLPLGDRKAGVSADLDALAAYVASLNEVETSPYRQADGALSPLARQGMAVFTAQGCGSCHVPTRYASIDGALKDIGTIKPSSGQRLGQLLQGIETPTLLDAWATAPYLHDGSAASLSEAITAHRGVSLSSADLAALSRFVLELGGDAVTPPSPAQVITVEAESGTRLGRAAVVLASNAYEGQVMGSLSALGSGVELVLTSPASGQGRLVLRYSNGGKLDASLSLYVNQVRISPAPGQASVIFARTGGVNRFATIELAALPLVEGSNRIRLVREASDVGAVALDRLVLTTAGDPPAPPPFLTRVVEAETGLRVGSAAVVTQAGASGGRAVHRLSTLGAAVEVTVDSPAAGWGAVAWRYANALSADATLGLYVNGTRVIASGVGAVPFAPTGGAGVWAVTPAVAIPLRAGTNTVRLVREAGQAGSPAIDLFSVAVPER
ncbi:MAG: galactose oxidase-like domain-containing protein [Rubrivivax sp.]